MNKPTNMELPSLAKDANSFFDKLYSHFLHRDLIYVVNGVMVVFTIALTTRLSHYLFTLPNWIIVIIIIASYYIGLLNQEFWVWLGVFKFYPSQTRKKFVEVESKTLLKLMEVIDLKSQSGSWKIVERIIVIKHVAIGFGGAILICLLIFIASLTMNWEICRELNFQKYWFIIIPIVIFSFAAYRVNRDKAQIQDIIINELTNNSSKIIEGNKDHE